MENKTVHAFWTKASEEGIVESIVAIMGNVDEGRDRIMNGAFTKTIGERLGKVRVLDQHATDSTLRIVGKPLEMRELRREELPEALLAQYPSATGGLYAKTQFLMDTPEGAGVFKRIKAGALDEWSIGYDALDKDYSKETVGGIQATVRNLRTIKLYEYSPVIWGMNPATGTLSAKEGRGLEGLGDGQEGKNINGEVDLRSEQEKRLLQDGQDKEDEGDGRDGGKKNLNRQDAKDAKEERFNSYGQDGQDKGENGMNYTKAGRVLSERNVQRIMAAFDLLRETLEDAGVLEMEVEDEMGEGEDLPDGMVEGEDEAMGGCKPGNDEEKGDEGLRTVGALVVGAGPGMPPTPKAALDEERKQREMLRMQIEIEMGLLDLKTLEV